MGLRDLFKSPAVKQAEAKTDSYLRTAQTTGRKVTDAQLIARQAAECRARNKGSGGKKRK